MSTLTWQSPAFDPRSVTWPQRARKNGQNRLDRKRISAITAVVLTHLLIAGALFLPRDAMQLMPGHLPPADLVFEFKQPPPPPPPAPIVQTRPATTATNSRPIVVRQPFESTRPDAAISATSDDLAEELAEPAVDSTPTIEAPSTTAAPSSDALLVLRNPPPPYPVRAKQLNQQGTVRFQVDVDETGRVQQITLLQSSGHSALDRIALTHIKRRWVFQPRSINGQPVASSGIGSINFVLGDL